MGTNYVAQNSTTVSALNEQLEQIQEALEDTLSRSGATPNESLTDYDMNGNRILNLPAPGSPTEPVRLQDLTNPAILDKATVLDNVQEMKTTNFEVGNYVVCKRYYANGGLVDGLVYEIQASASVDEFINHTLGNGTIARLIDTGTINVKQAGAVGNNSTDDTLAIQAAIDTLTNNRSIEFDGGFYRVTAPLVMSPTSQACVIKGNGSTIRCNHNGDGLVVTSLNENFSRHSFYDLTVQGPNISFPDNPTELAGTSTGYGLKIGRDNTDLTATGYLNCFYNCNFTNFKYGVYLQNAINCKFYGGYLAFNQIGLYVDAGQTNINTFFSVGIRQNRQYGVFSSGRSGGTLTRATQNVFNGCIFETNIPYDLSNGGYPSAFDPNIGYGVLLNDSYDWSFTDCYFENHNYSVVLDNSSDDNRFSDVRFDGGSGGRSAGVNIRGNNCSNNLFLACKMNDFQGPSFGTFQILGTNSSFNQILDCSGFSFNDANLVSKPYIRNLRKNQGSVGEGDVDGAIKTPLQGILINPNSGTDRGQIDGINTASATINIRGTGEMLFGNSITAPTTIVNITGMQPGQFFVLTNYQNSHPITVQSSVDGINGIVLAGRVNAVLSKFSDSITFYCNAVGKVTEVGRSI